jgi:hypothetical protein
MKTHTHTHTHTHIFNRNIILGLGHSPGGRRFPPLDFATDTCLPQVSRLLGRV